ncbi:hypothetical protein [Lysobacter sp. H23M47]|uniref:hypothetical protein n=1 Tax=Lysobacter sp. H23M47 TaxID=2781024 RepID=UPI00187E5E60|nr:hypothetical protein [Lysobacter sp. H23M47]QOW25459.1 hypothetical protein INQ43_05435 [Lysobacter sp. H23M47]
MADFDRFTTDHWTVAFPGDWIDKSEGSEALYFESPHGDKGLYISLWLMSDQELRGSRELVETFQTTEIASFLPKSENWELLNRSISDSESPVIGFWEGINHERSYRVSGKQLAAAKFVLRATFHDYDCSDRVASAESFAPIIDSLQLREA